MDLVDVGEGTNVFGKAIVAYEPGRRDQGSCTGLHTIDCCFNVFMLDFTNGKRRKGPVSLIAMRLNMTFIDRQYVLNLCAMLVAKGVFERDYLFVAAYSQNIRLLFRFVHPTSADGRDDT